MTLIYQHKLSTGKQQKHTASFSPGIGAEEAFDYYEVSSSRCPTLIAGLWAQREGKTEAKVENTNRYSNCPHSTSRRGDCPTFIYNSVQ